VVVVVGLDDRTEGSTVSFHARAELSKGSL